jgi:hypothetical protein
LKMGCPETSLQNYHSMLRSIPYTSQRKPEITQNNFVKYSELSGWYSVAPGLFLPNVCISPSSLVWGEILICSGVLCSN